MRCAPCAVAVVVVVAAAAGCKKSREVDCGMAAKGWVELVHRQLDSDGDAERTAKASAVVPALREELVARCRDEGWTLEARRCIADARTPADLERCSPGRTAADPAAAPAGPGAPADPAAAPPVDPAAAPPPAGAAPP